MAALQVRSNCCWRTRSSAASGPHYAGSLKPVALRPLGARRSVLTRAGKIQKITGEQLEVEIQDRDRPLVIDFFATWCGPCLLLSTELEKVAEQLGDKVKIVKIDVDENPDLSTQLRIEGLPTIVFIPKDGSKPALRTEGLLPAEQILEIINEL